MQSRAGTGLWRLLNGGGGNNCGLACGSGSGLQLALFLFLGGSQSLRARLLHFFLPLGFFRLLGLRGQARQLLLLNLAEGTAFAFGLQGGNLFAQILSRRGFCIAFVPFFVVRSQAAVCFAVTYHFVCGACKGSGLCLAFGRCA